MSNQHISAEAEAARERARDHGKFGTQNLDKACVTVPPAPAPDQDSRERWSQVGQAADRFRQLKSLAFQHRLADQIKALREAGKVPDDAVSLTFQVDDDAEYDEFGASVAWNPSAWGMADGSSNPLSYEERLKLPGFSSADAELSGTEWDDHDNRTIRLDRAPDGPRPDPSELVEAQQQFEDRYTEAVDSDLAAHVSQLRENNLIPEDARYIVAVRDEDGEPGNYSDGYVHYEPSTYLDEDGYEVGQMDVFEPGWRSAEAMIGRPMRQWAVEDNPVNDPEVDNGALLLDLNLIGQQDKGGQR